MDSLNFDERGGTYESQLLPGQQRIYDETMRNLEREFQEARADARRKHKRMPRTNNMGWHHIARRAALQIQY